MDIKIVVFPGTNREKDMADAFERLTDKRPEFVWHKDTDIGSTDLIVMPGGFAHGDYLRCGAMAANSPIMKSVIEKANNGTPVFGVCNGFQTMIESRLLPGGLLKNAHLKFVCKQVTLRYDGEGKCLAGMDKGTEISVPVAHGDGNYFIDADGLKALNDNGQIAFRYIDNPNGSIDDIAGITDKTGRILGMMPHPENATAPHQMTRDGNKLLEGILNSLQ